MDTSEFSEEQIEALQALADGYNDQSMSRRDVMKLVGAGGVGALLGGGGAASAVGQASAGTAQSGQLGTPGDRVDVFGEDLDTTSVNTEQVNSTIHVKEQSETALRNALTAAGANGRVVIHKSATPIPITSTLDFPANVKVESNGSAVDFATPTMEKQFNGTMATYSHFTRLEGIYFDGNRSTYSGDGLVHRSGISPRQIGLQYCAFENFGGAAFEMSETYMSYFEACTFNNSAVGVQESDDNASHSPHNVWIRCRFTGNDNAGIDTGYHLDQNAFVGCLIDENTGPGIHITRNENTVAWSSVLTGGTQVQNNDGPAILAEGAETIQLHISPGTALSGNAQNPDAGLTTPVADGVHHEGGGRINGVTYGYPGDVFRYNSDGIYTELRVFGGAGDIDLPNTFVVFGDLENVGSVDANRWVGFDSRHGFVTSKSETYSESNATTDRTFDAGNTTTAELANVVGTLINDLRTIGLVD